MCCRQLESSSFPSSCGCCLHPSHPLLDGRAGLPWLLAASQLVCTAVLWSLKAPCLSLFLCLSPTTWRSPKCNLERYCSFWSPATSLSYIPIFSSGSIPDPHRIAKYGLPQIRVAGVCREMCLHLF